MGFLSSLFGRGDREGRGRLGSPLPEGERRAAQQYVDQLHGEQRQYGQAYLEWLDGQADKENWYEWEPDGADQVVGGICDAVKDSRQRG